MGYSQAGFTEIVGVDIEPQPNYPFEFHQMDALDAMKRAAWLGVMDFDLIHASPPCQRWAEAGTGRRLGEEHPDLLTPTRAALVDAGVPYVIENIPNAPMPDAVLLCGRTFGLPIVRHRLFETSFELGLGSVDVSPTQLRQVGKPRGRVLPVRSRLMGDGLARARPAGGVVLDDTRRSGPSHSPRVHEMDWRAVSSVGLELW